MDFVILSGSTEINDMIFKLRLGQSLERGSHRVRFPWR